MRYACLDAASSNKRVSAVDRHDVLLADACTDTNVCISHQHNIDEADALLTAFPLTFLKFAHAITGFTNIGTHRLRMLTQVRPVLNKL